MSDSTPKKPGNPAAAPGSSAPSPASSTPPADPANRPTHFEAVDASGRRVRLSREEFRSKALPDLLKANGSDPDRLAAVILQAAREGFAGDVLAAANRLTVIDKNLERALSILAVVQRDAGEADSAEATLRELLQRQPKSAAARVGLGLLAEQRGDLATAERLCWEALEQDCNHPDAVHAFLQLRHRAVGDPGYRQEVERVAALPGSWRAQLWLARFLLQQQEDAAAELLYRDVLSREEVQSDALVMASADLVQAQKHDLVATLIAPRFLPGKHHPHTGLALLHHHLARADHAAGQALLHQMHLHYGHLLAAELQPFTAQFDRMRLAQLPPPAAPGPQPRVGLYRLDRPIWLAGLEDPAWLLPQKAEGHKHVLLFALAVDGLQPLPPSQEDEIGRLTRSVPLWLAEQVWLATPHRGSAALPLAEHGGWAVMGRAWQEEQLCQQLTDAERAATLLVTGQLRLDGERRRLDLWVYDCATRQRTGHAAAEGGVAETGKLLLQVMGELWPLLGGPAGHKPPVGDEAFWQRYVEGLGQHAALVVTAAGGMPKDRLYGERYITQWLQNVALAETRWQPGFWLLASALCVLQQLGSKVPLEHARFIAEVFRQSPPNSAFARFGVLPLRAVGLDAIWQGRRPEIVAAAAGDANYLAWLERAERRAT